MASIPSARGESEKAIRAWRAEHPDGTQAECVAAGIAPKSSVSRIFRKMDDEEATKSEEKQNQQTTEKTASPVQPETPTININEELNALRAQVFSMMEQMAVDKANTKEEIDINTEANTPQETASATEEKRRGPRRVTMANGLRPGQERATFIVDSSTMDMVRDIAYTRRMSMKELMNEILTQYLSGIDASTIEHRPTVK